MSVALLDGRNGASEFSLSRPRVHSSLLIPYIDRLLADTGVRGQELTGIGVARGPGSFTGIRIGLTAAKTLSYAWGVRLVGLSTLRALSLSGSYHEGPVCTALDAKKDEVFAAVFHKEDELVPEGSYPLNQFLERLASCPGASVLVLGDACIKYDRSFEDALAGRMRKPLFGQEMPRALNVALLAARALKRGESDDPVTLGANYLRRSEAEINWERKMQKNSGQDPWHFLTSTRS